VRTMSSPFSSKEDMSDAKAAEFDEEARRACSGASTSCRGVKATLGPKGRNIVIDKKFGSPTIPGTA